MRMYVQRCFSQLEEDKLKSFAKRWEGEKEGLG